MTRAQWEDCKVCGGDHWAKDHPAAETRYTAAVAAVLDEWLSAADDEWTVREAAEFMAPRLAALVDVERLADALRTDIVQDAIQRWMPTDQTSHVAAPLAAAYAAEASDSPEKPEHRVRFWANAPCVAVSDSPEEAMSERK